MGRGPICNRGSVERSSLELRHDLLRGFARIPLPSSLYEGFVSEVGRTIRIVRALY